MGLDRNDSREALCTHSLVGVYCYQQPWSLLVNLPLLEPWWRKKRDTAREHRVEYRKVQSHSPSRQQKHKLKRRLSRWEGWMSCKTRVRQRWGWPLDRGRALQTEGRGCSSKQVFKDRAGWPGWMEILVGCRGTGYSKCYLGQNVNHRHRQARTLSSSFLSYPKRALDSRTSKTRLPRRPLGATEGFEACRHWGQQESCLCQGNCSWESLRDRSNQRTQKLLLERDDTTTPRELQYQVTTTAVKRERPDSPHSGAQPSS